MAPFGYFSSPEIDRESDLLREIERLRAALEKIANDDQCMIRRLVEIARRALEGE